MNVAFNTAVSGMLTAQSNLADASRNLVNASTQGEDLIQPIVAAKQAEIAHKASAMMVKTASDMTDTLLDIIT